MMFKGSLLLMFALFVWHECAGVNQCTGDKEIVVVKGEDLTLRCTLSTGNFVDWWRRFSGDRNFFEIGFCSSKDPTSCTVRDNTANYTFKAYPGHPLTSELTIPGTIQSKLKLVKCRGYRVTADNTYEDEEVIQCRIRFVDSWLITTTNTRPTERERNDDDDDDDDDGDTHLKSFTIIAVSAAGGGVLIILFIVIVVIVIVFVKRRRDTPKRNHRPVEKEVNDVVEYINDTYVSAEDFQPVSFNDPGTPANQNTSPSSLLPPPTTTAATTTTAAAAAAATTSTAAAVALSMEEDDTGYSSVSLTFPTHPPSSSSSSSVTPPAKQTSTKGLPTTPNDQHDSKPEASHTQPQAEGEYAVVWKSKLPRNNDPSGDIYAQVQKKSKRNVAAEQNTNEEAVYSQVKKPKSSALRSAGEDTGSAARKTSTSSSGIDNENGKSSD